MHDLPFIRQNPAAFDAALARRGLPPQTDSLLALDAARRAVQTELQEKLARRNDASRLIGEAKRKGENADALMAEVALLKDAVPALEEKARAADKALDDFLANIPNLPADDVPTGKDETQNVKTKIWGEPRTLPEAKEHFDLGPPLGMDFDAGAKLAGARFTLLRGTLARLERALGDFMLDLHTRDHGYTEISPPLMVNSEVMFGTGQLPKFQDDQFQTNTAHWLIPTAEVPLTNLAFDTVAAADDFPQRFVARTPCFRAEAGAAGKDTRGMLRQHQFYKVELVSLTLPEQSAEEHERMTEAAERVLQKLELPYRKMLLCTGDMGFAARKTYDLEVWLPGQNTYREISSCSNCGDFQARRMKARFKRVGAKQTEFIHTLNGSGVAIGRCLIAILENGQQPDGSIRLPEALRPYMNGRDTLKAGERA